MKHPLTEIVNRYSISLLCQYKNKVLKLNNLLGIFFHPRANNTRIYPITKHSLDPVIRN